MSCNLTQVRDYIKTRIAISGPSFQEWTHSLEEIGNIPQTILDTTYHISLGDSISSPLTDRHIVDTFNVTVTIFRRAYNEPVVTRDEVLQTAHEIRIDMINPINVEEYKVANDGNIEDVQSVAIRSSEINTDNDNIIKVEIEFNVRLFFGIT